MNKVPKMYLIGFALLVFLVGLLIAPVECDSVEQKSLSDYCLDGKHHKFSPGPESSLYNLCSPWKNRSCCTRNTTERIHDLALYRLNYSQCHPLSQSCKEYFIKDLCFYECSPNIGPWVEKVFGMEVRTERFKNVPLCKTDCDDWFQACKNDFVCSRNWVKEGNKCSKDSYCASIEDTYHTAKNFCEEIWDFSWKYTPDNEPCMKMWFDPSQGNPNDNVTLASINRKESTGLGGVGLLLVLISILLIILSVYIYRRKNCSLRGSNTRKSYW